MTISFRTRLFVVSALIVAAVLTTVMTLGWSRILKFEVERLDNRLCMEARRLATQPLRESDLLRLEADLIARLRLGSPGQLMLRIEPTGAGAALQSAGWSDAPAVDILGWSIPARADDRGPPPPRRPAPPPGQPEGLHAPERPSPAPSDRFEPPGQPPPFSAERFEPPGRPPADACTLASFTARASDWRMARFRAPSGRSFVASDMAATRAPLLADLQRALTLVVPLALTLTALGAWLLASLTMRPVNRLRNAMQGVTQRALDQRLDSQGEDREFQDLIGAYNTMLARLEASFHQASRFSADAAHELKTPLTILQGRIELAVRHSDRRSVQADLSGMLDEVGRLSAITRKLLLLSQADAGHLALHRSRVDLSGLLDNLMSDMEMLLTDQQLSSSIARDLVLDADALLLTQLLNNLISNAVRYCVPGGWIAVQAVARAAGVELLFANSSRAIGAAERARFFDRFYRGDAAHNRQVDGSGLGLSLAREIARAHGGDLTLEPGVETEVRLRLWLPAG